MRSFNQTANDLEHVIENLDLIANKDILNFDSEEKILKTLTDTRSIIEDIDIMSLFNEIWAKTSFPDRVSQAELLFKRNFSSLFSWKEGIDDIKNLRNSMKNDCLSFYERNRLIGNTMSSDGLNNLLSNYDQIGLRLLKQKRDYKRLIEKIYQNVRHEEKIKKPLQGTFNKFILNPDKKSQFAAELSKLYKEDFFLPVSEDTEIKEEDILYEFQVFLDVELLQFIEPKALKIVGIYLSEITAETFYDFEKYLLHSNKNLLAKKIRETFTTEKGKAISLLLYALETNNPPLITIGNRQLKSIYRALEALLNRDIGTYQSITHKYSASKDKPDLDSICLKLNHILTELDKELLA